MAHGEIGPELAEALRANPNVERVTARTVVFRRAFIEHALDQYLNFGKPRLRIFEEAGIDVGALGRDRVAAAFGNWLTKVKRGLPVGSPPGRPSPPPETTEAERLRAENERLRMAVDLYRQLRRLDRRHQPQKQPPRGTRR